MSKYDKDRLKALPIDQVIEWLGGEAKNASGKRIMYMCFNGNAHKENDKHPSLAAYTDKNICKCFACGVGGDPLSIATKAYGNFKDACEAMSNAFNIPTLDGEAVFSDKKKAIEPKKKRKAGLEFDYGKNYTYVDLKKYMGMYEKLSQAQKLKVVYTFIYRYSLSTEQTRKLEWYEKKRGIKDHYLLEQIGWLGDKDVKAVVALLREKFPVDDLVSFKLFNPKEHKTHPLKFRYYTDTGFAVVPFHELYTDMVNGFMLRNISPNAGKMKEFKVSASDIAMDIPFCLERSMFHGAEDYVYITEGHVDGLSLGGKPFVASPGTYGLRDEVLPLFKGKKVFIAFDMDEPGRAGAIDLYGRFKEIGIDAKIIEWDPTLGKDLNELLLKGGLKKENLRIKNK